MAKNSQQYAQFFNEVASAVQNTSVKPSEFGNVQAAFDALSGETALQVVTRSRAVTHRGPKNQLALIRATFFLRDVTNLYHFKALDPVEQREVDGYMESGAELLETLITVYVSELINARSDFKVKLDATVAKRPKIETGGYKISLETRHLISGVLTRRADHNKLVAKHYTSAHASAKAWSDARTLLLDEYTRIMTISLSNFVSLGTAADTSYDVFKAFFRAVGNENQGKIDLAGCLFKALEDYAPWPVSLIGKVGSAAVGQFHAPKDLLVGRALSKPVYFNSDAPLLAKANEKLQAVKDWKSDITRLGVDPVLLPPSSSIKLMFDTAKGAAIKALDKAYTDALDAEFGRTVSEMAAKSDAFYLKVLDSMPNAPDVQLSALVVMKTNKVCEEYKTALQKTMGTLNVLDAETLQPFIEQYLFACYLEAYIKDDDFAVSISDELIKRLEGGKIDLIVRKTDKGQTALIYSSEHLPWADGHPKHVGALVLYFRWFKDNINPFRIATGEVSVDAANKACRKTIATLGAAIKANLVTRTLRHDTADWTRVKALL